MQERKEYVEDDFRVCVPTDTAAQKFRNTRHQALAHLVELGHGARLRKEPLAIPERMRVLGAKCADRRMPHVAHHEVGANVGRELGDVDVGALVDGAPSHENFAALIKAEAPAERSTLGASL